jgi:hypothetical protein
MKDSSTSFLSWRTGEIVGAESEEQQCERLWLFADDGYFGGGDFEADELVAGVEVEKDFDVGGGGFPSLRRIFRWPWQCP